MHVEWESKAVKVRARGFGLPLHCPPPTLSRPLPQAPQCLRDIDAAAWCNTCLCSAALPCCSPFSCSTLGARPAPLSSRSCSWTAPGCLLTRSRWSSRWRRWGQPAYASLRLNLFGLLVVCLRGTCNAVRAAVEGASLPPLTYVGVCLGCSFCCGGLQHHACRCGGVVGQVLMDDGRPWCVCKGLAKGAMIPCDYCDNW